MTAITNLVTWKLSCRFSRYCITLFAKKDRGEAHDILQWGYPVSGLYSNPASYCYKANTLLPCQPNWVHYCVTARTRMDCLANTNTERERSMMNVVMLNAHTPTYVQAQCQSDFAWGGTEQWSTYWIMVNLLSNGQLLESWSAYWVMVNLYARVRVCVCGACVYVCMNECVYMYECICMSVCMCICLCICA